MKLTDLNPYFNGYGDNRRLVFDCPKHCSMFGETSHSFVIPVGKQPNAWQIDSEDLNTITMRPSVLDVTPKGECGVHFFITKGEIIIL